MSFNSLCSISTGLPVIFLEARVQGHHRDILAQLGLSLDVDRCCITLFTRTNGIVLVASVGSYLAYRIFARFLDRRFWWSIVDFTLTDSLSRADLRFLHRYGCSTEECRKSQNLPISNEEEDDIWETFSDESGSGSTHVTYLSPESSPLRCRRWIASHSPCIMTECSLDEVPSTSASIVRSSGDSHRPVNRRLSACTNSVVLRRLSEVSAVISEQSSSVCMQWDNLSWDFQTDSAAQGVKHHCQSGSPSNVSELSEFRTAKRMFDDLTALSFDDNFGIDEGYLDSTPTGDESVGSISEARDFIERNCMTDSKHLYHIATGCSPGSDNFSVCSNYTTRSFHSLRNCAASTSSSNGLLDLTHSSTSSASTADAFSNSMTDSAISRGTASTADERCSVGFANEIISSGAFFFHSPEAGCVAPFEDAFLCTVKRMKGKHCPLDQSSIVRRVDLYEVDSSATPVLRRTANLNEEFEAAFLQKDLTFDKDEKSGYIQNSEVDSIKLCTSGRNIVPSEPASTKPLSKIFFSEKKYDASS